MDKLVIEGGQRLEGPVSISGSKNAALPLLFASILTGDAIEYTNVPNLADIDTTEKLLARMGVTTSRLSLKHSMSLQTSALTNIEAPYDLVRTMRASVLVLGPTLARFGESRVSLPGGCSIGARPINLHLMALEKMGAEIELAGGYVNARAKRLRGADITFDQVSVGATENTLMAACLASGTTVMRNAAREPEIVDLARLLRAMGARIHGDGTSVITVEGVEKLHGARHEVIADRIEAGTYLIAGAITGGEVFLPSVSPLLLEAVLEKLRGTGCVVTADQGGIRLKCKGALRAVDLSTDPFPGFPTDMQAQFMTLMAAAEGTSVITENIFENRFMHVAELLRLGADVSLNGRVAHVRGLASSGHGLSGATVMATDLRASACLVLAGLVARGTTTVRRVYHLDRGYERMEVKLAALGAKIKRERE